MRVGQESVIPIPPGTKLWRYMEAKKVLDLLLIAKHCIWPEQINFPTGWRDVWQAGQLKQSMRSFQLMLH